MASLDVLQREIAIFWDYENLALPSWAKPSEVSRAIVETVSKHGRIVDRRLYNDFSDPRNQHLWSTLDSSGFDLVNTPRRNQKETLDKKLIADVLTFAWDSAVRNEKSKPAVVLLTNDGDFAYCVSKLRDRGVMSIVIYRSGSSVASILKDSADMALDLQDFLTPRAGPIVERSPRDLVGPATQDNIPPKTSNNADQGSIQLELDIVCLCQIVAAARKLHSSQWVAAATVGVDFAARVGKDINRKERYKNARDTAVRRGLLARGRRLLCGSNMGEIVDVKGHPLDSMLLSKEEYIKLAREDDTACNHDQPVITQAGIPTVTRLENATVSPESAQSENGQDNAGDAVTLCQVLEERPEENPWLVAGTVALLFRHRLGPLESVEGTERYRWALTVAKANGWLEGGRRVLVGPTKGAIEHTSEPVVDFQQYSTEQYLRITAMGSQAVLDNAPASETEGSSASSGSSPPSDGREDMERDRVILKKAMLQVGAGVEWLPVEQIGPVFALALPPLPKLELRKRFRQAWNAANKEGHIEEGRRVLVGPNKGSVDLIEYKEERVLDPVYYSSEAYLRLTKQASPSVATPVAVYKTVFIKNIPRGINVHQLVRYLEDQQRGKVATAYMEDRSGPWASYWFAHVKFTTKEDAGKILALSNSVDFALLDRVMIAEPDKFPNEKYKGNPEYYYDCTRGSVAGGPETVATARQLSSLLFVKNIALSVSIQELVDLLRDATECTVLQAQIDPKPYVSKDFNFAWVEVESVEMAEELVEFSRTSELRLHGRRIEVLHARNPNATYSFGSGPLVYKRGKDSTTKREAVKIEVQSFCRALDEAGTKGISDWVTNEDVSTIFFRALKLSRSKKESHERFGTARFHACRAGCVEAGRRNRGWGDTLGPMEPLLVERLGFAEDPTVPLHLRLTTKGLVLLGKPKDNPEDVKTES